MIFFCIVETTSIWSCSKNKAFLLKEKKTKQIQIFLKIQAFSLFCSQWGCSMEQHNPAPPVSWGWAPSEVAFQGKDLLWRFSICHLGHNCSNRSRRQTKDFNSYHLLGRQSPSHELLWPQKKKLFIAHTRPNLETLGSSDQIHILAIEK